MEIHLLVMNRRSWQDIWHWARRTSSIGLDKCLRQEANTDRGEWDLPEDRLICPSDASCERSNFISQNSVFQPYCAHELSRMKKIVAALPDWEILISNSKYIVNFGNNPKTFLRHEAFGEAICLGCFVLKPKVSLVPYNWKTFLIKSLEVRVFG